MAVKGHLSDVSWGPLEGPSVFVQPIRMKFKEDGKDRYWDLFTSHDSVGILMFDKPKKEMIFVRQFRPAVYLTKVQKLEPGVASGCIDCVKYPSSLGYTTELCSGIIDKSGVSALEVAQWEMLEECGYRVPKEKIEKIAEVCSVATNAAPHTIFYAEVDDSMKVTEGGGLAEEDERIEVLRVPLADALKLPFDESPKPAPLCFAILWFQQYKLNSLAS